MSWFGSQCLNLGVSVEGQEADAMASYLPPLYNKPIYLRTHLRLLPYAARPL